MRRHSLTLAANLESMYVPYAFHIFTASVRSSGFPSTFPLLTSVWKQITDSHGNLQYIPFPVCNETSLPLSFEYQIPKTQTCTIDLVSDDLYHLLEFFVHSDVPLTCRVPSYPLDQNSFDEQLGVSITPEAGRQGESLSIGTKWTPFTIALQGTLQLSHLHLHTNINVLFHTAVAETDTLGPPVEPKSNSNPDSNSHIIASTAYSIPISPPVSNADSSTGSATAPSDLQLLDEGSKIIRNAPLILTFNVGWIDGPILPGMPGRPLAPSIVNHGLGLSLLSLSAMAASAGLGAMAMLIYERRLRSGRGYRAMNGLLGGNVGNGVGYGVKTTGYGSYGGFSGVGTGKRD